MTRLAVLGAGVMGETVFSGLLRSGWAAEDIVATARRPERGQQLAEQYGIGIGTNTEAATGADVVLVAVKPQDIAGVLDEISAAIGSETVVASLAAGVGTEVIEARLPARTPVVRVMPNTPSRVDAGMSTLSGGRHADRAQVDLVAELLSVTGEVAIVAEKYQDAVTAISGSGPAYLLLMAESMIEGGVHLGLPRPVATQLAVQTMYGSAKLLKETGEHPALLRERVTSPGGTTAAALRVLEDQGVRAAVLEAMEAARDRSRDLSAIAAGNSSEPDPASTSAGTR